MWISPVREAVVDAVLILANVNLVNFFATDDKGGVYGVVCTVENVRPKQGAYHADLNERGMTYEDCFTLTGSGPATWAHDHTEDGIFDLCGNVWEWVSGLRQVLAHIDFVNLFPANDKRRVYGVACTVENVRQLKFWNANHYVNIAVLVAY